MIATLLVAALLTPQEAELKAKLPEIFAKSAEHYRVLDAAATPLMKDEKGGLRTPHGWNKWRTGKDEYDMRTIYGWTAGHFPGSLWYLYEATGDDLFKERATAWTEILEPNKTVDTNHDVGFITYCSFGNARRILKTDRYDAILAETASSLARRFNDSLGVIRSWGMITNASDFLVIPDNMMNLELLEAVSKFAGDPRFDKIARSHANVSMRHHFRADGGCYHVLDYDQRPGFLGTLKEIRRGQGLGCETAWSRGQSWAIYGYTMMYRETKDPAYLAFAQKVSDFAIDHPNMPADGIPYWDYGAPGEERDSSAGSIMASGLLELAGFVGGERGAKYRAFAVKQLLSLASPDYFSQGDEIGHFLLKHGVGHKPGGSEVDTPLDYGDYYFLEALLRFRASAGVADNTYLDIMEKAVTAYSDAHISQYVADVERSGVQEHGFPRLTANLGILVANGRLAEKKDVLKRMMTASCRDAAKGKMPPKSGGNEFSVKELAYALVALEKAGTFPKEMTDAWRADLMAVDAKRSYSQLPPADRPKAANWSIFGCASEQVRLSLGLGGDPAHVEYYVADQLKWFDELGMYKDPNQPAVYDMVTRLQFAHILAAGYDGPSRPRLEELMDKSAEPTLKMLSACGEIPYGGRSNQFLHNHTCYAALCEWYAARYAARGETVRVRAFRSAAKRATDALVPWLERTPVSHVKNGYPREEGKGVYSQRADMGCEGYAYFDKYMITMGSWAMSALQFRTGSAEKPDLASDASPSVFVTSPEFHWVFLSAGPYSAQFDWNANPDYDSSGLGRIHRRGAPPAICLSTPCARHPHYRREIEDGPDLAILPVAPEGTLLRLRKRFADAKAAHAEWAMGELAWACTLAADGFVSTLTGPSDVALALPAFESDGTTATSVVCDGRALSVAYGGWVCRFVAEGGAIVATDVRSANRNGVYRRYEARGTKILSVKITIERERENDK